MKYSEAEEKIEALSDDFGVELNDNNDFYVVYQGHYRVAYVNGTVEFGVHADYTSFLEVPKNNEVFKILVELAATPVEERGKKKRHYIKIFDGPNGFLNIDTDNGRMSVYDSEELSSFKTKFTDKEIEELKARDDVAIDWNKARIWDVEED